MEWMQRYCDNYVSDEENVIMLVHAPPLNPEQTSKIKEIVEKIFPEHKEDLNIGKTNSINLLKEYSLMEKLDDPRVDPIIDLKVGTIMKNWENNLLFLLNCKRQGIDKKIDFVFSGHSHKNLEFRIENIYGRERSKTPYLEQFPFHKINIPCAVYIGDYSKEYRDELEYIDSLEKDNIEQRIVDRNFIVDKTPFIIITTSIGPRSQDDNSRNQGYREIIIKNNRIESFFNYPILKYFIPFDK